MKTIERPKRYVSEIYEESSTISSTKRQKTFDTKEIDYRVNTIALDRLCREFISAIPASKCCFKYIRKLTHLQIDLHDGQKIPMFMQTELKTWKIDVETTSERGETVTLSLEIENNNTDTCFIEIIEKSSNKQIIDIDLDSMVVFGISAGHQLRGTEVVSLCCQLLKSLKIKKRKYSLHDGALIQLNVIENRFETSQKVRLSPLLSISAKDGLPFYARFGFKPAYVMKKSGLSREEQYRTNYFYSAVERVRQLKVSEMKIMFVNEPNYNQVLNELTETYLGVENIENSTFHDLAHVVHNAAKNNLNSEDELMNSTNLYKLCKYFIQVQSKEPKRGYLENSAKGVVKSFFEDLEIINFQSLWKITFE